MKLEVDKYRWVLDTIKRVVEKDKENKDITLILSELASSTGVPILALVLFSIELYGESEELNNSKNNLIKFYGYESIE